MGPSNRTAGRARASVIAPDLLGHGKSDKPRARYGLDFFATSLSELLTALGIPRATVAGHSLGGAIAVYFGRFHPAQLHRLVLVSSGGLGREVHLILRAATVPGASHVLRAMVNERTAPMYRAPRLHRSLRLRPEAVVNLSRMGRALVSADGRSAFFTAARSVMYPLGQRGSMLEMGFLAPDVPTLIVWSEKDAIIPVSHAYAAHHRLPGSTLALLPDPVMSHTVGTRNDLPISWPGSSATPMSAHRAGRREVERGQPGGPPVLVPVTGGLRAHVSERREDGGHLLVGGMTADDDQFVGCLRRRHVGGTPCRFATPSRTLPTSTRYR